MSVKFGISVICLVLALVTKSLCIPTSTGISDSVSDVLPKEQKKCQPNLCEMAKFKCISADSCNGTLVPPTEPCQCCPSCIKFREEGEECEIEETSSSETTVTSDETVTLSTTPVNTNNSNLTEGSEVVKSQKTDGAEHERKLVATCKPGLTCLLGTCVVLL